PHPPRSEEPVRLGGGDRRVRDGGGGAGGGPGPERHAPRGAAVGAGDGGARRARRQPPAGRRGAEAAREDPVRSPAAAPARPRHPARRRPPGGARGRVPRGRPAAFRRRPALSGPLTTPPEGSSGYRPPMGWPHIRAVRWDVTMQVGVVLPAAGTSSKPGL